MIKISQFFLRKFKSLEQAYYLILLPFISLVFIILFLIIQSIEAKDQFQHEFEKFEKEISKSSIELAEPLWNLDSERIEGIMDAMLSQDDISGFSIYDEKKAVYLQSSLNITNAKHGFSDLSAEFIISFLLKTLTGQWTTPEYYLLSRPIEYKTDMGTIAIGQIDLYFSDQNIRNYYKENLIRTIWVSLSIFIIFSLGFAFLHRIIIITPVKTLKKSIENALIQNSPNSRNASFDSKNELVYLEYAFTELWKKQSEMIYSISDSKEYYKELLNILPIGVYLTDHEGKIIECNETLSQITGFQVDELIGSSRAELLNTPISHESSESNDGGSFQEDVQYRNGKNVYISRREKTIYRNNQQLTLITVEDITLAKQTQLKLQKSEQFLRETDAIARIGGWEIDVLKNELYWTEQIYAIHELPTDFIPTLETVINFYHPQDRPIIEAAVSLAISEGKPFQVEARIISFKNNEIWVQAIGSAIMENNKVRYVRGTFQDITQRKMEELKNLELERQISHQSKLDILGHLAGGVAHDFNNILTGIINSADLLNRKGNLNNDQKKYLDIIIQSSDNGSRLSNKLLTFARKESTDKEIFNVYKLLDDTVDILKTLLNKNISLTLTKTDLNRYSIFGEYSSLQNALLNMGINSSHAMPKGGSISIEVVRRSLTAHDCAEDNHEILPGEYIEIVFSDTGEGIPESIINKVFDPFFTTKEKGMGTGLGLAAVKRTITEFDGEIRISSTVGKGTSISLLIPATLENLSESEIPEMIENTGKGLILFVDDEEINRSTSYDILDYLGYNVLLASNGKEALDIFQTHHSNIDLIIMDMIMPVMDGEITFKKIKELNSSIPIILCSGYAQSEKVQSLLEEGLDGIISKPFKMNELSEAIKRFLT